MAEDINYVRVGIYTRGEPSFDLHGNYEITDTGESLIYRPLSPECRCILKNQLIGKDFHWQKTITTILPGDIEILKSPVEGVSLINRLPIEKYLECVVGSEMNPAASSEFVKAHAIISRSWLYRMIDHKNTLSEEGKLRSASTIIDWEDAATHTAFDVCSDDHCQRYQGERDDVSDLFKEAVKSTAGLVIVDADGEIADARYSKCCGGLTEAFSACWQPVDFPYLIRQEDSNCDFSELPQPVVNMILSKYLKDYDASTIDFHDWEMDVRKEDVGKYLFEKFGRNIGEITDATIIEKTPSGRAIAVRLSGTEGSIIIGKELMIRRLFSQSHLYSAFFDIENRGDSFHITGKGWGHGVGLCQTGAARMAFFGASYEDILSFYYPNSTIAKLY